MGEPSRQPGTGETASQNKNKKKSITFQKHKLKDLIFSGNKQGKWEGGIWGGGEITLKVTISEKQRIQEDFLRSRSISLSLSLAEEEEFRVFFRLYMSCRRGWETEKP